ncbi:unnamed protein product [Echinostoma caproni]|uniref:Orange domain-containing protein n=1 Tax=Echinostoma caproni TaxID=27848 RepID=A0A183AHQ5_9TREM|nr:unnamed protein product [Echinostoma caproni]
MQVIEKRRRDRINSSLHDLKRLVPDNVHKPNLRVYVWAQGHVLSAEARAVELRRAGFKDCLLEVTRLLSSFENQATVHPEDLKRSILAHLQQCDQQRDQEAKAYLAHVAAVANAIGTQTAGSMRSSSACASQSISTATTAGAGKAAKRTVSHQPVTTPGSDANANGMKSSTVTARQCPPVTNYLSYLNPHNVDRIQSSPSPYILSDLGSTASTLSKDSVSSYAYSPMKRLSGPGTGYHQSNGSYYHADYGTNGEASNYMESTAYSFPNGQTPSQQHRHTQMLTQHPPGASSQQTQSFIPSYSCANPPGPNESQSTSSPPFHSTPDDTEVGVSPNLLGGGKMTNSTESYSDPSISIGQVKSEPIPDDNQSRGFTHTPNKSVQFYPPSTSSGLTSVSADLVPTPDQSNHHLTVKTEKQSCESVSYPAYQTIFDSQSIAPYESHATSYDNRDLSFSVKPTDWCCTATESNAELHNQTAHQQPPSQTHHFGYVYQWDYAFQAL